jgi:hypothetical protein
MFGRSSIRLFFVRASGVARYMFKTGREPREPFALLLIVSVPVIHARDARQHVAENSLGHLVRTPESSQHGSGRAAQIVRRPM